MDSNVAKANAVPIIGYALGGEIRANIFMTASSSHSGGDLQQRSKPIGLEVNAPFGLV